MWPFRTKKQSAAWWRRELLDVLELARLDGVEVGAEYGALYVFSDVEGKWLAIYADDEGWKMEDE